MRIMHAELDAEITRDMEACLLDLKRVGIACSDDRLVDKALELYCKGQFNYQDKGKEFSENYEKLRDAMSLCQEYNGSCTGATPDGGQGYV